MKLATAGLVTVLMVAMSGCGTSDSNAAESKPVLEQASSTCLPSIAKGITAGHMKGDVSAAEFMTLGDDGHTLSVQNSPRGGGNSALLTIPAVACVLHATNAPDSVAQEIDQSSALAGRQSETWGKFKLDWSYNPDDGVSAVFTES